MDDINSVIAESHRLRDEGRFVEAAELLARHIGSNPATDRALLFEIEKIRRTRMDYTLTREAFLGALRARIPGFTDVEFDALEQRGIMDTMTIDGQKLYLHSSETNLFIAARDLRARDASPPPPGYYAKLRDHAVRVLQAHARTGHTYVVPQDYEVSYAVTVHADAVPAGRTVRCWLPFVRSYPFQTGIELLDTDPAERVVAPPDAPHRTVYLEKPARQGVPTRFAVHFRYRCWAEVHPLDPAAVLPYDTSSDEYRRYTASKLPHIDLDDAELRGLNARIVGGERNPLVAARRIFDWISREMIYQHARAYSTLDNISRYCARRMAGDCGQHALVFITLCRMNAIPARWQSGWQTSHPRGHGMHDWTEFFVEPYGWVPADPDAALNALDQGADELGAEKARELADFYFGNLGHFRMALNCDVGEPLFPPKDDFRSDTVDFQRGEVECDGHNLYYDMWDDEMNVVRHPTPDDRMP